MSISDDGNPSFQSFQAVRLGRTEMRGANELEENVEGRIGAHKSCARQFHSTPRTILPSYSQIL